MRRHKNNTQKEQQKTHPPKNPNDTNKKNKQKNTLQLPDNFETNKVKKRTLFNDTI